MKMVPGGLPSMRSSKKHERNEQIYHNMDKEIKGRNANLTKNEKATTYAIDMRRKRISFLFNAIRNKSSISHISEEAGKP